MALQPSELRSLAATNLADNVAGDISAADVRQIIQFIASFFEQMDARGTRFYFSRGDAVIGAADLPSSVTRIVVQEGGVLVIRSRTGAADDPLFETGATWGASLRIDIASKADISLVTPSFATRAAAVTGAALLPTAVTQILVVEGSALVIRSRTASADDALFGTGSRWGVTNRIDMTGVSPRRIVVLPADAASARNSAAWLTSATYYSIQNASVSSTPLGTAVVSADVDVVPAPLGVRQIWRMSTGETFERTHNGSTWSAFQRAVPVRSTLNVSALAAGLRSFDAHTDLNLSYTFDGSNVILLGPFGTSAYSGEMSIRVSGNGLEQVLFLAGQSVPWLRRVSSSGAFGAWRRQSVGGLGRRLVLVGDSKTFGIGATDPARTSWAGRVADTYGAETLKWGVAGAAMSPTTSTNQAIIDGSFSRRMVAGAADLATATDIVVDFGTNDWNANVPLGALSDTTEATFLGAMRVGLNAIRAANPASRVLFMLPTFRSVSATNSAENLSTNSVGRTLADYRAAIVAFCIQNRVEYIDAYSRSGVTAANVLALTTDGLHPNDALYARLAIIVSGALLGLGDAEQKDAEARASIVTESVARATAIAEILAESESTEEGRPLIRYRGNGRVALTQKTDGLDFIPSADLAPRMAQALEDIGFSGSGGGATSPAGTWAPKVVNPDTGLIEFSAVAGPDGLVDRFRAIGSGPWRPTPRNARVICGYGQSQSGIHQSGNEPVVWGRPPVPHHILTLDDMQSSRGGVRGHLGGVPLRVATALVPATTLVTAQGIQDIATSMAATLAYLDDAPMVYACRTEGRGGMPMIGTEPGQGIYRDSTGATTQQFANLIDSSNRMVTLLVAEGYTVDEITILFDHAEADGLAGISRAQYLADFNAMAAEFEAAAIRPVHWLITQPVSGEGPLADNHWQTRLALHDIGARANATLVCAKYDLPIGNAPDGTNDWVHTSYKGRVILGEYYAHADYARRKGKPWIAPWVSSAVVSGNTIVIDYNSELPMRFDAESMFTLASRPQGVELGGTGLPTIQSVTRTGFRQFTVVCSASPAGKLLRIGFSPRNAAHAYGRFPVCTTSIRDDWSQPSRWVPGFTLRRWAWGQEIAL